MGTGQRDAAELRGHILGVTASAAGSGSSVKATLGARCQTIIVPAYQYPTLGIWPTLAKIGPSYKPWLCHCQHWFWPWHHRRL